MLWRVASFRLGAIDERLCKRRLLRVQFYAAEAEHACEHARGARGGRDPAIFHQAHEITSVIDLFGREITD